MESSMIQPNNNTFNKSLDELIHFADNVKLRENELEHQHSLEIEKLKREYNLQVQIEKTRYEQLQQINRQLTEQVENETKKQLDLEHKYSILTTKYNCSVEEVKRIREQNHEKIVRIEELERIARILKNDKIQLDEEIKQLKLDKQNLEEKMKQTTITTQQQESEDVLELVQKAIQENNQLKALLAERDSNIEKLNEKLSKAETEDPQLIEQRLLQLLTKLKSDFNTMFEDQNTFFLQKIDYLKQEQRINMDTLLKHVS